MEWFLILGFAISSSVDNLGVGISYGIRNIRVSRFSNLVIAIICFLFSVVGILFGNWLSIIIPGVLPDLIAAFVLFVIGIRIILLAIPHKSQPVDTQAAVKEIQPKNIKALLKNPEMADMDNSREIGLGEAAILGIALSANALTNGLSAGLIGLSPVAISLMSAAGSFIGIWLGVSLGHKIADVRIGLFTVGEFATVLSGFILLIIAAHALF